MSGIAAHNHVHRGVSMSVSDRGIPSNEPATPASLPVDVIRRLNETVSGLQYGTVTLVFHDGKVIQIERNEKLRLSSPRTR
jgi:hypothetical protein